MVRHALGPSLSTSGRLGRAARRPRHLFTCADPRHRRSRERAARRVPLVAGSVALAQSRGPQEARQSRKTAQQTSTPGGNSQTATSNINLGPAMIMQLLFAEEAKHIDLLWRLYYGVRGVAFVADPASG